MKQKIYQTKATAAGGRNGKVKSEDGVLEMDVRIPKSMGGPGGDFTNPEQLFAAGYAACFDSALNLIARQSKHKITSETEVSVGLESSENNEFNLVVSIGVSIEGTDKETARNLLELAHKTCPYSKAVKNNVDVTVHLN
jgi:Ohr subfamily peroxiredoxin